MSRGSWNIEKKVGGSWTADSSIYPPNEALSLVKNSTQNKTQLADGSNAYITPSTKYLDDPIVFTWLYDDGTMKDKIEAYINNQNDLRITDHNSDTYVGRFVSIESSWRVGESQDNDRYDIQARFSRMPSIE
jgi:hypothetical protein